MWPSSPSRSFPTSSPDWSVSSTWRRLLRSGRVHRLRRTPRPAPLQGGRGPPPPGVARLPGAPAGGDGRWPAGL